MYFQAHIIHKMKQRNEKSTNVREHISIVKILCLFEMEDLMWFYRRFESKYRVNYLEFKSQHSTLCTSVFLLSYFFFLCVVKIHKMKMYSVCTQRRRTKRAHTKLRHRRIKMDLFVFQFQFLSIVYPWGFSTLYSMRMHATAPRESINGKFMSEFYQSDRILWCKNKKITKTKKKCVITHHDHKIEIVQTRLNVKKKSRLNVAKAIKIRCKMGKK